MVTLGDGSGREAGLEVGGRVSVEWLLLCGGEEEGRRMKEEERIKDEERKVKEEGRKKKD